MVSICYLATWAFFIAKNGPPTGSETSLKRDVNCIQNVSTRRLSLQCRQFADDHRLIITCRRIRRALREMEIIIIKFVAGSRKVQKETTKIEFRSLSRKCDNSRLRVSLSNVLKMRLKQTTYCYLFIFIIFHLRRQLKNMIP